MDEEKNFEFEEWKDFFFDEKQIPMDDYTNVVRLENIGMKSLSPRLTNYCQKLQNFWRW